MVNQAALVSGNLALMDPWDRWVTYASVLKDAAPVNMTVVFETMAANATQEVDVSLGIGASACANGLVLWSTNATVQVRDIQSSPYPHLNLT